MSVKNNLSSKDKLRLILRLSSEISASNSLRAILEKITDGTKKVLSADRCTIFLLDKEKEELYSWVAHGLEGVQIRLPVTDGLAGHVASTGEAINIVDAYKDSRFNASFDRETGYRTKTVLCMPMKNQKGKIIGVFQVLNKKNGNFNSEDEDMLNLLCGQAASSLESTLLCGELKKTFVSFIRTLSEAIDARDPITAGHSLRVAKYAVKIAKEMGYSKEKIEILEYAALLHDLGKIGVREEILTKPGKLTKDEYLHIQSHVEKTRKILEKTYFQPEYRDITPAAAFHHENFDGSGYPMNKKANEIPEMARIIAVADVFDSLTYKRHYRKPMLLGKVLNIIKQNSGKKFDPRCVEAFFNLNITDVLKLITEDPENKITKGDLKKLQGMSLGEFRVVLEEGKYFPAKKIFDKCYRAN